MALEESFITLIINHARIEQLSTHALDSRQPGRQVQALKDIKSLIQEDETALEEARKAHLAPALTKVLARATDEAVLDATSSLMSVLTGATVHRERLLTVAYPVVGQIAVHECSLSEGVGARLWGISHSFNKYLISQKHEIEGKHVLEIGSGVGSTGVVAAKLNPISVTVTDLTAPLLQNLRATVLKNCAPAAAPKSPRASPDARHPDLHDLQFSDAESVSDEGDLFAADGGSEGRSDGTGAHSRDGGRGVEAAVEGAGEWDVGIVRVRVMDWKAEWDAWVAQHSGSGTCEDAQRREDDTTSALDVVAAPPHSHDRPHTITSTPDTPAARCDGVYSCAPARGSRQEAPHAREAESPRDTFDVPGDGEGLPPAVPADARFGVVLGCEVLYELPHAAWVAATVARRLEGGGTAWVAGAVRDLAVYEAFGEHLSHCGLVHTVTPISPSEGYHGLGNKEDIYEDGYRMYCINHR